jgi:hypothetical protein
MNKHTRMLRLAAAGLLALMAFGTQAQQLPQDRPVEQTYRVIVPQKVETGERVEVIDFFWYG